TTRWTPTRRRPCPLASRRTLLPMVRTLPRWQSRSRRCPRFRLALPTLAPMTTLICNCNQTMPIDGPALARALGPDAKGADAVHSLLCRREPGASQRAARSTDDLLVACTQESRLFVELAGATEGAPPLAERP